MRGTIWRMIAVNSHVSMCMKWELYGGSLPSTVMYEHETSVYLVCTLEMSARTRDGKWRGQQHVRPRAGCVSTRCCVAPTLIPVTAQGTMDSSSRDGVAVPTEVFISSCRCS